MEKSKFPSEVITLPSNGYFYEADNPLSSGQIEIRYPTAKDEDILTSKNLIQKGVVIDKFLQAIIVTPVNYDSLLLGDKNGIMIAARILAYGKDYEASLKCEACGETVDDVIDLSLLESKELDFESMARGNKEIEFTLPVSNKNIKLKLLTQADANAIEFELKSAKKFTKRSGVNKEITTRLRYAIIEVEGDRDKNKIRAFVEELYSQDSLAIRGKLNEITPDIETDFNFSCDACGNEEVVPIPMGVRFFWPSGRV